MYPGKWAAQTPDKPAVIMADTGAQLSYAQLEERSLRLANHFRAAGLGVGDHVAVIAENRFEIIEAYWAAQRSGVLITVVNRHLTPSEVSYIVHDCDAAIVLVSRTLEHANALIEACADVPEIIVIGGSSAPDRGVGADGVDGGGAERPLLDYEAVLAAASPERPDYEARGDDMLYSSGTTGRPKGILPAPLDQPVEDPNVAIVQLFTKLLGFNRDTVYLSPAPLYHAAPIRFVMTTHAQGGTAVIMPRFDEREALTVIERYRVTHSQWVPTMFVRMLKLPEEVRRAADTSSLRVAVHAAAPCPVEVKRAMIEWWGPVIWEYYAATEANGVTAISSEDALAHPGSVGRDGLKGIAHICGPDGEELPPGEVGVIYFENDKAFEYYKDADKTAGTRHPDHPTWTAIGDLGWMDEDRFLYLADRQRFLIISGGVNIYPQEIENELALLPALSDVAVVGEPDEELGQIVVAYATAVDPSSADDADPQAAAEALAADVVAHLRDRLARFKIPRVLCVVDELPRTPTGKLVKRNLDPARVRARVPLRA